MYSWTVVTHQVHPAYPTPYTLVLVDLDDAPGTHFVGQVPGTPEMRAGMPMELWFDDLGSVDGAVVVPNWRAGVILTRRIVDAMTTMTTYPHGVPSWIDLATPDPAASKAFYAELFGWEYSDEPTDQPGVDYTMCRSGAATRQG